MYNHGLDDENFDYIVHEGEVFHGRYAVRETIGKGECFFFYVLISFVSFPTRYLKGLHGSIIFRSSLFFRTTTFQQ